MRAQKFTVYAKESGVEFSPSERRQPGKPEEGRIALRFFRLTSGAHQIRFVVEPWEAYELSRRIDAVAAAGGKETITHKFDGGDGETVTKVSVESYERNGRKGYAFSVQRGEEGINVAAPLGQFLFAAEFLRTLSVAQSWIESVESPRSTGGRGGAATHP